jgi:hypothetical protein
VCLGFPWKNVGYFFVVGFFDCGGRDMDFASFYSEKFLILLHSFFGFFCVSGFCGGFFWFLVFEIYWKFKLKIGSQNAENWRKNGGNFIFSNIGPNFLFFPKPGQKAQIVEF